MSSYLLTNVLDVARALGPQPNKATPNSVYIWFRENYLQTSGGGFNYDPAISCLYDLFRGAASKEQAQAKCLNSGNPKGRKHNASAVLTVAPYALANQSTCHKIGNMAVQVGKASNRDVFIGIKAPFIRVNAGIARLVMPGFRMGYRPTEAEIDVACSIVRAQLARDDYAEADIEYLFAGPSDTGAREFRALLGSLRDLPSIDEVEHLLQVYVEGIDLLIKEDRSVRAPNFRGYQRRSLDQPDIFTSA